jgi:acetate---CoA ligase (ADP-forming)
MAELTPTAAVTLRDGSTIRLRRAGVTDEPAVLELFRALSIHSLSMRFGTVAVHLPSAARAAVNESGVIAFSPEGRCVGHAWYVRTTERRAEVALVVTDRYHGRGLGTILLKRLAEIAAEQGIDVLEGYVLFNNVRMTELLSACGLPVRTRADLGGQSFELDTHQVRNAA